MVKALTPAVPEMLTIPVMGAAIPISPPKAKTVNNFNAAVLERGIVEEQCPDERGEGDDQRGQEEIVAVAPGGALTLFDAGRFHGSATEQMHAGDGDTHQYSTENKRGHSEPRPADYQQREE